MKPSFRLFVVGLGWGVLFLLADPVKDAANQNRRFFASLACLIGAMICHSIEGRSQ